MPPASWSAASSGSTTPAAAASPTARCSAASPARMPARKLLRRLDAVLAHRHPLRRELAVGAGARAAEDGLARLQVRAAARDEAEILGLRRHQDLLLAVLVLQRELVAAAHLRGAGHIGVGHQRVGNRIP